MLPNTSKFLRTACIAAVAVCTIMTAALAVGPPPDNLGLGYVSSVTSNGSCVASTTNGGGIQFWDIQAGGTYEVTLTGVTDCGSQGNNSQIGVVVHNSDPNNPLSNRNIFVLANQTT